MDELELEFELDPVLVKDTYVLGDFPLCRLLLAKDANYPWFILVPRRVGATELYHLSEKDQFQLIRESSFLAENLADLFGARKMNVATIGNMVSQLHMHHVVRYEKDAAWPKPIWGAAESVPYTDDALKAIKKKVKGLLDNTPDLVIAPE